MSKYEEAPDQIFRLVCSNSIVTVLNITKLQFHLHALRFVSLV